MIPKKLRVVESTLKPIRTTPSTVQRLDPDEVARALGAEPSAVTVPSGLAPIALYAVRIELFKRLRSQGAASGSEAAAPPGQIPLSAQDWRKLEDLAARIAASTGLSPSPEQVGRALLSVALRSVTDEVPGNGGGGDPAALVNELTIGGDSSDDPTAGRAAGQ